MLPTMFVGPDGKLYEFPPVNLAPGSVHAAVPIYRWHWHKVLGDRHGQLLRVLVRGARNSCLVEFCVDNARYITSRNGMRRAYPSAV